ncbi:forkhead-associated domain-containing protein 1-like, partial [Chiloscyllium plagiosum]|uniref:forkhead-associated domain-containing protein 1-like n=1 Tax=Chiloscyllium plagiosum TaxID=36176 RepID=UPI001CB85F75
TQTERDGTRGEPTSGEPGTGKTERAPGGNVLRPERECVHRAGVCEVAESGVRACKLGTGMKGYLKFSNGIYALKTKTTTIGRLKESALCLQNRGIDDRHALIELNDSENCFVVQDLNSSNGTFVNDCRIQNAAVRLAPGDVLRFGIGGDTFELLVETVPS